MRKLLLLSGLIISMGYSAQVVTNCETVLTDTNKYVQSKTSSLQPMRMNQISLTADDGYCAYGQRFEAPDSIKVMGFCFYAYVLTGAEDTVVCRLYDTDASDLPSNQIDSVIVTVPANTGYSGELDSDEIKLCATFGNGHMIEGDYIVTVENFSNSEVDVARNTAGDGASEDLTYAYYYKTSDHTWDGWYDMLQFSANWNVDLLFEPLIEYTVNTTLTLSDDTICYTDSIHVDVVVEPFDDSIFYNKMYNPGFATYTGMNTMYSYDFGDGQSNTTGDYLYADGGDYFLTATSSFDFTGWTIDTFVNCVKDVYTGPTPDLGMDTTLCNNYTLTLDAGVYDSYDWNTGQTTQTITAGPMVSAGDVTYVLEATEDGCSNVDSLTVTFQECVGIEELGELDVTMYPNPANEDITLELASLNNGELQILNAQGQIVLTEKLSAATNNIGVSHLESGVYFISVIDGNKIWKQKLQIVR